MKCTNCGASLSDSAKFCPECGTKVVRELFCAECGTKLAAGTKFCPECGTKVGGAVVASTPKAAKESYPKDNGSSKWLTIEDGVITKCDSEVEGVVIIPEGVTEIEEEAFARCEALESVVIPPSVETIGEYAFSGCESLRTITVARGNKEFKSIDGVLYSDGGKTLLHYPAGKDDEEFTVPDDVETIGEGAFDGCEALESVKLPDGLKEIGVLALNSCNSLKQVRYEGTTDEWEEVEQGESWLYATQVKKVRCSDGFGELSDDAFGEDDEDEDE